VAADEERIALFLDYENLAIGAREALRGAAFDLKPVADALAERGRVVVRKAYADWRSFDEDRRMLTRHQFELIEIPQRMGSVRKNAADIKMAVDAVHLCLEREYITTFVLGTGDSDFTPLVHKLRELNKRVIGVGVEASTSALLPPACDEFLFYERLEGVEAAPSRSGGGRRRGTRSAARPGDEPIASETGPLDADKLVTQTLAGLERSGTGPVIGSMLKRTILRKEPTFNEADYGFRGFVELLRNMADRGLLELAEGTRQGDPVVSFATGEHGSEDAFELVRTEVAALSERDGAVPLSGLKSKLRRKVPDFSEKQYGYSTFLQFMKAARARGDVDFDFDDAADDYLVRPGAERVAPTLPGDDGATGGDRATHAEVDHAPEGANARRSGRGRRSAATRPTPRSEDAAVPGEPAIEGASANGEAPAEVVDVEDLPAAAEPPSAESGAGGPDGEQPEVDREDTAPGAAPDEPVSAQGAGEGEPADGSGAAEPAAEVEQGGPARARSRARSSTSTRTARASSGSGASTTATPRTSRAKRATADATTDPAEPAATTIAAADSAVDTAATSEPPVAEPAVDGAVASEATADEPVTRKTATRKPAARKTATRKPAAKNAAAEEPAARKPAARKPATRRTASARSQAAGTDLPADGASAG